MTAFDIADRATQLAENSARRKFKSSPMKNWQLCEDPYVVGYLTGSLRLAFLRIIRLKRELRELKKELV